MMKRNPQMRLGSGSIAKYDPSEKSSGIKASMFEELPNGVVGAVMYLNRKIAEKELNARGFEQLFSAKYPKQIFEYEVHESTVIGAKRGSDWSKIKGSLYPNGSPYTTVPPATQDRSADEGQTTYLRDRMTGDRMSFKGNPISYDMIITVPHAHDDGLMDGHDTDVLAPILGEILFESFEARGVDALLLVGEKDRDELDLNRKESHGDDFHTLLDQYLPKAEMLFDIHSYPTYYPVWNEYDVVLFHCGPYHSDKDNDDVAELGKAINAQLPDVKLFIEMADEEKHFIQNKGLVAGKESFLIEINESRMDLIPDLAEAIAEFALGIKTNPPTQIPPGAKFHQFVISLPLSQDPMKPRRLMFPEIFELELEERGFVQTKKTKDATDTITESMTFALPDGFPTWDSNGKMDGPTINFRRNQSRGLLSKAQFLSNDEVYLVATLVAEAAERQPLRNPFDKKELVKNKLQEFGVEADQTNAVFALIQNEASFDQWNSKQEKRNKQKLTQDQIDELIDAQTPSIDQNSSDNEIKKELSTYGYDVPEKNNKFNRSRALQYFGIVGDWSDNSDIEKELRKRNKKVPKKGNNLDRDAALKLISDASIVTKTSLDEFVEAKPAQMKLSTPVTQAVLKALIPGARKISSAISDGEKRKIKNAKGKFNEMTYTEFVKSRGGNLSDKQQKQWDDSEVVSKGKGKGKGKGSDNPNEKRTVDGKNYTKDEFSKKFRPGRNKSIWKKWDDAVKANPAVVAVPSEGKFVMDVTDEAVQGAKLRIFDGKPKLSVQRTISRGGPEWVEGFVDEDGLDRDLGNIIRINMFRKSAGFTVKGVTNQPPYIISIETGGKHFYVEDLVSVDGLAILRHFPSKKSEPRLRLETRGTLSFSRQAKTVMVRGKPHKLYQSAKVVQTKANPSYSQQYIEDHIPLDEKKIPHNYKKYKLNGPLGSDEFFEQIASKVQVFGEGQGWVRDGCLYWRVGDNADNYVNVDGLMIEGGEAWMHTHPAAWEPSQTSPDDFIVMHGMFTNHGVKDFFTIIADRVDWFRFRKPIKVNEMVEVIEDFEKDIHEEFNKAETKFQAKMGDEPYLTSEQTRYITHHFNKTIPEFSAVYKAYSLSPQQINERTKRNPPPAAAIRGLF
jgi:hypothetical protein